MGKDPGMRTQFETLLVESRADQVLVVTINRPAAANAINTAVGRELLGFVWAIAVKTEAKFTEDLTAAA